VTAKFDAKTPKIDTLNPKLVVKGLDVLHDTVERLAKIPLVEFLTPESVAKRPFIAKTQKVKALNPEFLAKTPEVDA